VNRELLKKVAPSLRALGFRGSGQNYRKTEGDFVFIINFQGSSSGDSFFVNLGAQPTFIPSEGEADPKKLKEYDCVFRRRMDGDWRWNLSESQLASLVRQVASAQAAFFENAQTLRSALAVDSPDTLLSKFTAGTSEARAALHLARAAVRLGHLATARGLVERGFELAGDRPILLLADLQRVRDETAAYR